MGIEPLPPASSTTSRSEEWLQAVANTIPSLLWASGPDGEREYVNDRWLAYSGRTLDEECGAGWTSLVHPDDLERCLTTYSTHHQRRERFETEYRLRRHDGVYRCMLDTAAPRMIAGEYAGFAGSCVDVTALREPNGHLGPGEHGPAFSDDLYHALAEATPALVLTTSADGEVEYCNRRLLDYCGTSIEDLRGARWVELIHPDDVSAGRDVWTEQVQTLRPFSSEYRIRRHDGAYRWHLTHTAPLRDANGDIQAWVGVSLDVHDRREAEEHALEIAAELERASAAKDQFLALVSHELRTPIATIYGNAQILRRLSGQLDEDTLAEAMTDIERESIRLQQLVDNMFIMARLEDAQAASEPILLSRLVMKSIGEHIARYPDRAIEFDDDAGGQPVCGSLAYVEQILRNLLNNAEKYSPPQETIVVAIHRGDDHAVIRVLDRGGGLEPDERERAFETFYRAPRLADHVPGAGIGLSVCRRLVEAQGGQIWIQPREGGGAEAAFTLPFEAEAAA